LFRGSAVSVRLRIKSLNHGRQQIKDLYRRNFVPLLRILEVDIVERKSSEGNSYANQELRVLLGLLDP
jgi:hypothetical protein